MVILEFCQHGNLLSFMKGRRQIFKPIWSKQHVGMEHEFTTFDLCVAAYQVAKGLDFLASRKVSRVAVFVCYYMSLWKYRINSKSKCEGQIKHTQSSKIVWLNIQGQMKGRL